MPKFVHFEEEFFNTEIQRDIESFHTSIHNGDVNARQILLDLHKKFLVHYHLDKIEAHETFSHFLQYLFIEAWNENKNITLNLISELLDNGNLFYLKKQAITLWEHPATGDTVLTTLLAKGEGQRLKELFNLIAEKTSGTRTHIFRKVITHLNKDGNSLLHLAATKTHFLDSLDILINVIKDAYGIGTSNVDTEDALAFIMQTNNIKNSAICLAALSNHAYFIEKIDDTVKQVCIHAKMNDQASKNCRRKIMMQLNHNGCSPVNIASQMENPSTIKTIIKILREIHDIGGPAADIQEYIDCLTKSNDYGFSPFNAACKAGWIENAKILNQAFKEVNHIGQNNANISRYFAELQKPNNHEDTPLMILMRQRNIHFANWLLDEIRNALGIHLDNCMSNAFYVNFIYKKNTNGETAETLARRNRIAHLLYRNKPRIRNNISPEPQYYQQNNFLNNNVNTYLLENPLSKINNLFIEESLKEFDINNLFIKLSPVFMTLIPNNFNYCEEMNIDNFNWYGNYAIQQYIGCDIFNLNAFNYHPAVFEENIRLHTDAFMLSMHFIILNSNLKTNQTDEIHKNIGYFFEKAEEIYSNLSKSIEQLKMAEADSIDQWLTKGKEILTHYAEQIKNAKIPLELNDNLKKWYKQQPFFNEPSKTFSQGVRHTLFATQPNNHQKLQKFYINSFTH